MARLERDLTTIQGNLWALEEDVRRRFWERDERRLQVSIWMAMALLWIAVGALIATVLVKGH